MNPDNLPLKPLRLVPKPDAEVWRKGTVVGQATPMTQLVIDRTYRRLRSKQIVEVTARTQLYVLLHFARAMGNRTVKQIGRTDIEAWLGTLDDEPATIARKFRTVRGFFDSLLDDTRPLITRNPCRGIQPPRTPPGAHRSLTRKQMGRIIAAAPDELAVCHIILGVQCGLRVAEAAGAQLGNLNWEAQRLKVMGKGHKQRIVPVPDEAMEAIDDYLTARTGARTRGPLFRLRRFPSRGVTAGYVSEDFAAIAYAAGVKTGPHDGISYHALRHTAATDINRKCGNPVMVRDVLGHSDIATTDRYLGSFPLDEMAEAMADRTYRLKIA